MNALIKRLHDSRLQAETEARSIITQANDEKRELTSEEETTLARIDEENRSRVDRMNELLEAEERAKAVEDKLSVYGRKDAPVVTELERDVRAFLKGERRMVDFPLPRRDEARDITTGTGGTPYGGYTVATGFFPRLMEHMIEVSGIMQSGATIMPTANGEPMNIAKTTSHSTAAIVAEDAQISESQPVFGQVSLPVYKYGVLIQVSRELIDDTSVDLLGYLARQAGRAVGNAFGAHAITGDGSSKPYGIVPQSTLGVTGATSVSGVFNAANLIDLYYSVISPYRNSPSCGWLMRDASVATLRKITDPATGQYLWVPGLTAGASDTLLGKPLRTDPNVAATATSAKSVVFGDMSMYYVRVASGVRFERSDDFAFDYDLVTFRCLARMGGVLTDTTGAVKHFIGGAS